MDNQTLSYLQELMRIAAQLDGSRNAVERFMVALRKEFVFDNVAMYLQDAETQNLEIAFARAVGRSRDAEADAAWGEDFAGQVLKKVEASLERPQSRGSRLRIVYIKPTCLAYPFVKEAWRKAL